MNLGKTKFNSYYDIGTYTNTITYFSIVQDYLLYP